MITQKQKTDIKLVEVLDVSYAGEFLESKSGLKTHVIALTYSIDKEKMPDNGIDDIILTLSEKNNSVNIPRTEPGSSPKKVISDILNINSKIKTENTKPQMIAMATKESGLMGKGEDGFFQTFALMNPLCTPPKSNLQATYAIISNENKQDKSIKITNTSISKYGANIVTSLISVTKENKSELTSAVPISFQTDGTQGKIVLSPSTLNSNKSTTGKPIAVSLDVKSAQDYSRHGNLSTGALEISEIAATELTSGKNSISRDVSVSKVLGDADASAMSILIDNIDPANSAIIPRLLKTGDRALGEENFSDNELNTIHESRNLLSMSTFQNQIKIGSNIAGNLGASRIGDYEVGDVIAVPGIRSDRVYTVTQLVPVPNSDLGSLSNIFGKISVGSNEGETKQSLSFKIPMRSLIADSKIPEIPPTIEVCQSKIGKLTFNISQNDKKATHVDLYYKKIMTNGAIDPDGWVKVATSPLSHKSGYFFIDHDPQYLGPVVYRAIAKNKDVTSANFSSVVVQPLIGYGQKAQLDSTFAAISSEVNERGEIIISVNNIAGGPQAISLLRRDLTLFEEVSQRVKTQEGIQPANTGDNILFTDSSVIPDHIYEYSILVDSVVSSGISQTPAMPTVIKYIKPQDYGSISLSPPKISKNNSQGGYSVKIPILITASEGGPADIVSALKKLGIKKEDLADIPEINIMLNMIVGVIARRVDYATGVESYFGFTALENESTALSRSSEGGSFSKNYIGVFLDKGLPEKNISPPSPDRRYKYIFEVVFRDASSILSTLRTRDPSAITDKKSAIKRSISNDKERDSDSLTFTNDGSSGLVANSTNPNRPEKFYDERTLGVGPDAGTILDAPGSVEDDMEIGRTGIYSSINADLKSKEFPQVTDPEVRLREDGCPVISWYATQYNKIDHFLIQEVRHGTVSTVLSAHSVPTNGRYIVVDSGGNMLPGKVQYRIVIVDNNFKKSEPFTAGSVVIQGNRGTKVLVSGDASSENNPMSNLLGQDGYNVAGI